MENVRLDAAPKDLKACSFLEGQKIFWTATCWSTSGMYSTRRTRWLGTPRWWRCMVARWRLGRPANKNILALWYQAQETASPIFVRSETNLSNIRIWADFPFCCVKSYSSKVWATLNSIYKPCPCADNYSCPCADSQLSAMISFSPALDSPDVTKMQGPEFGCGQPQPVP